MITGVDLAQQQAAMRRQSSTAASRYASASEEFSQGSVGITPRMEGDSGGSRAAGSGMEGMTAAEARAMAGGGWGRAGVPNDRMVTAAGMVEPGLQGEGSRGLAQLPALAGRGQW
jgi:hypothetical protein